jgi:flagellar biosynthesis protein FlhA
MAWREDEPVAIREKNHSLKLLTVPELEAELAPWSVGEHGQQSWLKLRKGDEIAWLYAGIGGILEAGLNQTMMRLASDGWSVEGEMTINFDGTIDVDADAAFAPDDCLLELGAALLPLVDPYQNSPLLQRLPGLRREIAEDIGFIAPGFKVRDNMTLPPPAYQVRLRGTVVGTGEIFLDRYLALGSLDHLGTLTGWSTHDPSYRMPAKWIEAGEREKAEAAGCLVMGGLGVLFTHLREIIKAHASQLLGLQETFALVARLRSSHPVVVEDFLANTPRLRKVRRVLQRLLAEGVSIRDLVTILEELGDHLDELDDIERMTEYARAGLARQIASSYLDEEGRLRAMVLSDETEEHLRRELDRAHRKVTAESGDRLVRAIRDALDEFQHPAVLFTDPTLRPHVRRRLEHSFPHLAVLSTNEIPHGLRLEIAGQVKWPGANGASTHADKVEIKPDSKPTPEAGAEAKPGFWKTRKKKE